MADARDIQHDKAQLTLKSATRDLLAVAGGTDGASATLSERGPRVRQQHLSDCQNRTTDAFLRIDQAARLEDIAVKTESWPPVTRAMAARHGFDLVHRIEALPSNLDFCAALAAATREFGDLQQKILAALPDGVTAAEVEALNMRGEIADAQRCLARIDALCTFTMESGR